MYSSVSLSMCVCGCACVCVCLCVCVCEELHYVLRWIWIHSQQTQSTSQHNKTKHNKTHHHITSSTTTGVIVSDPIERLQRPKEAAFSRYQPYTSIVIVIVAVATCPCHRFVAAYPCAAPLLL